jgi:hypothetical protein
LASAELRRGAADAARQVLDAVLKQLFQDVKAQLPETATAETVAFGVWLDPELRDADKVTPLLQPYPAEQMEACRSVTAPTMSATTIVVPPSARRVMG